MVVLENGYVFFIYIGRAKFVTVMRIMLIGKNIGC